MFAPTSFPGSLFFPPQRERERDPGWSWSRGTQNLGACHNLSLGRGSRVCSCRFLRRTEKPATNDRTLRQQAVLQPSISTSHAHLRPGRGSRFFHSGRVLLIQKNYFRNSRNVSGRQRETDRRWRTLESKPKQAWRLEQRYRWLYAF